MPANTTVLSYQMMYESQFLTAMINAAGRNEWQAAAMWADNLARIQQIENPPTLEVPTHSKDAIDAQKRWFDYFQKKSAYISQSIGEEIKKIRAKYSKGQDIPRVMN